MVIMSNALGERSLRVEWSVRWTWLLIGVGTHRSRQKENTM